MSSLARSTLAASRRSPQQLAPAVHELLGPRAGAAARAMRPTCARHGGARPLVDLGASSSVMPESDEDDKKMTIDVTGRARGEALARSHVGVEGDGRVGGGHTRSVP